MVKQYDLFRHDAVAADAANYVIVLQSTDFASLNSVIVAPLLDLKRAAPLKKLHIPITVEHNSLHIAMHQLGAFPVRRLGTFVRNADEVHDAVMNAVDLLFAGF